MPEDTQQLNDDNNTDSRIEKLSLEARSINGYVLLDGKRQENDPPAPIGNGGSGIVYRARQKLHTKAFVDRAIKFFLYEDSIVKELDKKTPISESEFISEIGNITKFNHQSLIRVVDAGIYQCGEGDIPFIITDFIEGTTLKDVLLGTSHIDEAIKDKLVDEPDIILEFLLDVAYAIKHIHDQEYAHCDVAPKNIFIHFDGKIVRPILGDLGLCKSIINKDKSSVRIVGSKKWMPETALTYYDQTVDYSVFCELQPHWDIYSFAKTGLKLLEIYGDEKPRSWMHSLIKDFQQACSNASFKKMDVLIDRIEFLKPIHREVAKVPELSMGVGSGRKKMMPVEALTTTKRLHDLVRHPALLRLSYVPQLTTANQILPGANHTRYEHTLGVIETMRRYLLSLLDESEFLEHLSISKIETALLAGALSSATRFPLSNIIHEIKDKDDTIFKEFSKHSLYLEILRTEDSKGLALKNYIRDKYPNVPVSDLVSIMCGEVEKFNDADKLIYSLLNNSLDVRVIDFVRRDSHHLGIISGDSFRIDEILPHVTIHNHRLALKIQGVSVAEQIILLRYWLFSRVYWNQPNRIFCAMARVVFTELHKYPEVIQELRDKILKLDQRGIVEFLIEKSKEKNIPPVEDLANRLRGEEHNLFRVVYETSRINQEMEADFHKIEQLSLNQIESMERYIWKELSEKAGINCEKGIVPLLVDFPVEPGSIKLGDDVAVRFSEKEFKNLTEVSSIIKGVNQSFRDQLCRFRVFLHPDCLPEKDERPNLRKVIKEAVIGYLSDI